MKSIEKEIFYINIDASNKIALHYFHCKENNSNNQAIILCHGITYSSLAVFDIPIKGFSFAERLVQLGYDVFMLDFLGYGKSIHGDDVSVNVSTAIRDLDISVSFIRHYKTYKYLNIIGWSWGTQVVGRYISLGAKSINRLVLYGFKWHMPTNGMVEESAKWRINDINHLQSDFTVPETTLPDVMEKYFNVALEIDPTSPIEPRNEILKCNSFVNPDKIKIPTLIVHGHDDQGLDLIDSIKFYEKLKCIKYYSIIYGAHPIHMEKNFWQLLEIINNCFIGIHFVDA